MLTTKELENVIMKYIKDFEEITNRKYTINFKENMANGADGTYVFSNYQGYHYVDSERGIEITHKITDDVFEISFWTLNPYIIMISFEYERANRKKGTNSREVALNKQLELWGMLGDNFRKRGEIEVSEVLKANPL